METQPTSYLTTLLVLESTVTLKERHTCVEQYVLIQLTWSFHRSR